MYNDMKQTIQIKRAYDAASADDGFRVYIDRLWPQGLSHETFRYDLWEKQISPSTELREWFHTDMIGRWDEFVKRYRAELEVNPAFATFRQELADKHTVTLLYSSRDREHNNAIVVRNALESR